MKKYIIAISIFIFLINSFLFAQTVELNEQVGQFSEIKNIHALENDRWILSGRTEDSDNSLVYFSVIDTSELIKSNTLLDGFEIKKITIKEEGGFAWVINENNGKDGIIRIEVDSNFFTVANQIEIGNNEVLHGIEILPTGKLIIFGTKTINLEQRAFFKILLNNYVVDFEDYSTAGSYDDIIICPDSSFFMLVGNLGSNLVYGRKKYSWNYQPQGGIVEFTEPDEIFKIGDGYFTLKNQTLSKLDNDFQLENSINLESYGERIDIKVDDENAFVLFQKEEEAPMILKINSNAEVEDFFAVEDKYFRANVIHLSDDEIGVGGYLIPNIPFNNTPFSHPSTSGYFKTFTKNGTAQDEDIELEIIDIKIEDYEKKYTCGSADLADVYLLNLKKTKVSFVNKGTTIINEVTLFVQVEGVENCVTSSFDPKYYFQRDDIKMLNLKPGDTIHWRISALEFPQKSIDSTSAELCVWATSIENRRDQNDDNNYFCGAVELARTFEEFPIVKPTEEEVLIYPNPLDDVMKVSLLQAPFEPTLIEFYDLLGGKLEQEYIIAPRAKYKEIDISEIPSGFYFLYISNDLINEGVQIYVN